MRRSRGGARSARKPHQCQRQQCQPTRDPEIIQRRHQVGLIAGVGLRDVVLCACRPIELDVQKRIPAPQPPFFVNLPRSVELDSIRLGILRVLELSENGGGRGENKARKRADLIDLIRESLNTGLTGGAGGIRTLTGDFINGQ